MHSCRRRRSDGTPAWLQNATPCGIGARGWNQPHCPQRPGNARAGLSPRPRWRSAAAGSRPEGGPLATGAAKLSPRRGADRSSSLGWTPAAIAAGAQGSRNLRRQRLRRRGARQQPAPAPRKYKARASPQRTCDAILALGSAPRVFASSQKVRPHSRWGRKFLSSCEVELELSGTAPLPAARVRLGQRSVALPRGLAHAEGRPGQRAAPCAFRAVSFSPSAAACLTRATTEARCQLARRAFSPC